MLGREDTQVRLIGTEEQVQIAKGLIEDFVRHQALGLSHQICFFLTLSVHFKCVVNPSMYAQTSSIY